MKGNKAYEQLQSSTNERVLYEELYMSVNSSCEYLAVRYIDDVYKL